ncbi:MAG: hypothetical protein UZ09_BCD002002296 [Bacteroidetes bacterium OLB9]|nr:MAG: hypothetical protein UZ09_BCD002002296 [Bacteroidetes bacterium OLB9]
MPVLSCTGIFCKSTSLNLIFIFKIFPNLNYSKLINPKIFVPVGNATKYLRIQNFIPLSRLHQSEGRKANSEIFLKGPYYTVNL